MFELEKQIKIWRAEILRSGITHPEILEELENHLRQDFAARVAAGVNDADAFKASAERLGNSAMLRDEFGKIKLTRGIPEKLISFLWVASFIGLAIFLALRVQNTGLLLMAQILTHSGGYFAGLAAGVLAICCVCGERFALWMPSRRHALARTVFQFNCIAASLIAPAMVLGNICMKEQGWDLLGPGHLGRTFTLCGLGWILGTIVLQKFTRVNERTVMLLSIATNLVLAFAWFWPFVFRPLIFRYRLDNDGLRSGVLLFVAVNIFFILLGMKPAPSKHSNQPLANC